MFHFLVSWSCHTISYWDYTSTFTKYIDFPWPSVNAWHFGSQKIGDVTHYYTYYIENLDPTADPFYSATIYVGEEHTFVGSGLDPEGDAIAYDWSFDDGSGGTGATPTHYYMNPGTYEVSYSVRDYFGASSDTQYAFITVNPYTDATLAKWKISPSWHHGHPNDTVTLRAYVKNDGTTNVYVGVRFDIRDAADNIVCECSTQNVLLAPGESINGKADARMTASWTTPAGAGVYYPTGYLINNPDSNKKVRLGVK